MSCERIEPELVGYHFGVVGDDVRHQIEVHLMTCPECLRSFLALKRDIETGEGGPLPSPAVRDRIRNSAARKLGIAETRPWTWWERPLAFGFAGVVTLIAISAMAAVARGPGVPPHGLMDRPISEPAAR